MLFSATKFLAYLCFSASNIIITRDSKAQTIFGYNLSLYFWETIGNRDAINIGGFITLPRLPKTFLGPNASTSVARDALRPNNVEESQGYAMFPPISCCLTSMKRAVIFPLKN